MFTPDPANLASFRPEIYSLDLFGKMPTRGFKRMITRGAKESNKKVLHNVLKIAILGPCVEISPRRFNIFTLQIQHNLQV